MAGSSRWTSAGEGTMMLLLAAPSPRTPRGAPSLVSNRVVEHMFEPGKGVRAAVAMPSRAVRAEATSVGLLAARVAAAIRRSLTAPKALDDFDREELQRARDSLQHVAEAIRFAASAGTQGSRPQKLTSVGLTISAAMTNAGEITPQAAPPGPADAEEIARGLEDLASCLSSLIDTGHCDDAERVLRFFERLATVARNESATPSDVVVRPR